MITDLHTSQKTIQRFVVGTWIFIIAALVMWGVNIYKLVQATAFGGMEIARAFGIVLFPLGAILGFF